MLSLLQSINHKDPVANYHNADTIRQQSVSDKQFDLHGIFEVERNKYRHWGPGSDKKAIQTKTSNNRNTTLAEKLKEAYTNRVRR